MAINDPIRIAYNYNPATNTAVFAAPAGFYTYATTNSLTLTPVATRRNESKETSLTVDTLIESLFRLNPAAKKKYKGDKVKFAEAIVSAAEAVEQRKALTDLTDLGLAE